MALLTLLLSPSPSSLRQFSLKDAEADDGDVERNLKDKTRDRERAKSKEQR